MITKLEVNGPNNKVKAITIAKLVLIAIPLYIILKLSDTTNSIIKNIISVYFALLAESILN
jgi:hypothetical protein